MPKLDVNGLQAGLIEDTPAWDLAPGVTTDGRNVRYRDGSAEKVTGYQQVYGDRSATAIWAHPVETGGTYYWLYGSQGEIYATDQSTHASVTSASFSATLDLGWNGGFFNGYAILNNGVQYPQSWDPGLGNKLQDLTAWPVDLYAQVVRPHKQFIFAFGLTTSGDFNPYLMRWSASALEGELPDDWDYTDPANDSGINELAQTGDVIVDALPLRDTLMIYKEDHIWAADYIGGRDVFAFRQVFQHLGALSQDCIAAFSGMHFVAGPNDIIVHDGNQPRSVLDKRLRSWVYTNINSDKVARSFVVANHEEREMWFCFPQGGEEYPTIALVWDWNTDSCHLREFGREISWIAPGIVNSGSGTTMDTMVGVYDDLTGKIDASDYRPQARGILLCDANDVKLYQGNRTELNGGSQMTCYIERQALPLTKDPDIYERVMRVYPRVIGTQGDTLEVYVGSKTAVAGTTAYQGPFDFTIGEDYKVDCRVSGRVIDVKFEYKGSSTFKMFGYSVEWLAEGYR